MRGAKPGEGTASRGKVELPITVAPPEDGFAQRTFAAVCGMVRYADGPFVGQSLLNNPPRALCKLVQKSGRLRYGALRGRAFRWAIIAQ